MLHKIFSMLLRHAKTPRGPPWDYQISAQNSAQNSAHKPCKQCMSGVVFSKVLSDPVAFETLWSIISLLDEPFSLNVGAMDF